VVRLAERLPPIARRLQAKRPYQDQALIEKIVSLIEQRCALTSRRFCES
jgi:hypothetical protein